MANFEVNLLSVEDTEKFTNSNNQRFIKFIGLGIYSERTAQLLTNVIKYKWDDARAVFGYMVDGMNGGMLVQADGDVAINCYGEVGILFKEYDNIGKFIRVANSHDEYIKSIKDKIAKDLVKFWNCNTPNSELEVYIEGCNSNDEHFETMINFYEYRVLYEVLKGRDVKKIKAKYGDENFKRMIGESNKDQFVLTAVETILTEINNLVKERECEAKKLEEKQRMEKESLKNFYIDKIEQLEEQLKTLTKGQYVTA